MEHRVPVTSPEPKALSRPQVGLVIGPHKLTISGNHNQAIVEQSRDLALEYNGGNNIHAVFFRKFRQKAEGGAIRLLRHIDVFGPDQSRTVTG